MAKEDFIGKKVFFLYPHSVIEEEFISEILRHEYEVYFLKDHKQALRVFALFPDSIVFVNIDDVMQEAQWEAYIRGLLESLKFPDLRVGIVSYNDDEALKKKYLFDIAVQCGFVQLKLGVTQSTKIILKVLEANEAKGRRRFVRVKCENDPKAACNIKVDDTLYNGKIYDISSTGMACRFDKNPYVVKNSLVKGIQLKLRGSIITADGVILGTREDDPNIYVFIFKYSQNDRATEQIRRYIYLSLQSYIEKIITKGA